MSYTHLNHCRVSIDLQKKEKVRITDVTDYGITRIFVFRSVRLFCHIQKNQLNPEISLIRDSDFILHKIINHAPTHPHRTRRR